MYAQWNNLTFIYVLIYRKHVPSDKAFRLFSVIKKNHAWKNSYHLNGKLFHINSKHFLWSASHKIRIFLSVCLAQKTGWLRKTNKKKKMLINLSVVYLHVYSHTPMSAYILVEYWGIQGLNRLVQCYSRKISLVACSSHWLVLV